MSCHRERERGQGSEHPTLYYGSSTPESSPHLLPWRLSNDSEICSKWVYVNWTYSLIFTVIDIIMDLRSKRLVYCHTVAPLMYIQYSYLISLLFLLFCIYYYYLCLIGQIMATMHCICVSLDLLHRRHSEDCDWKAWPLLISMLP